MSDERDNGPNTEMFRAFVEDGEQSRPPAGGNVFRLLTLLGALVVFAIIVALLLR